MEALADMIDRALMSADGGNSEVGKAISKQIREAVRAQLERIKQTREQSSQGATHDNR